MQVVGEFSVEGIITNDVDALWDQTVAHAGIERDAFMEYFAGPKRGTRHQDRERQTLRLTTQLPGGPRCPTAAIIPVT